MRSIFLVLILFFPLIAFSATKSTGVGKITRVHFYEGIEGVLIIHSAAKQNPGCGRADQYILSKTHPFFDEIYSLLLAAAASQGDISITVSNHECPSGYPYVKHVYYTPNNWGQS